MMLKHRTTAILAAAAVAATTLAFTASAAVKDVQADTSKSAVCTSTVMDHADGNRQYKSEIRTDENGETYIIAEDGSKIYISWTEKESAMTAVSYTASSRLSRRILSGYQKG